jgi:hypothetical protein
MHVRVLACMLGDAASFTTAAGGAYQVFTHGNLVLPAALHMCTCNRMSRDMKGRLNLGCDQHY